MLLNLFLCHKSISASYEHFRVEVAAHFYHSQGCLHLLAKALVSFEFQGANLMVIMGNACRNRTRGGTDGVLRSLLFVLTWLSACLYLLTLFANCFVQEQSVRSVLAAVGFCSKAE